MIQEHPLTLWQTQVSGGQSQPPALGDDPLHISPADTECMV